MGSLLQGCNLVSGTKKPQSGGKRASLSHYNRKALVLPQFTGLIYFRNSEPLKWKEGWVSLTEASTITCLFLLIFSQKDSNVLASIYTEGKKISKPLALKSWQARISLRITSEGHPSHDQIINILILISLTLGPVEPHTDLVAECSWHR